MLTNLITNAIKYSPREGFIEIRLELTPTHVCLRVQDQGAGIPLEEQSNLFQPFGRTSVRTTAGEKSTGLGLAIARRIVEGHRGTLGVESEPGNGSTFWFSIPRD